MRVFASGAVLQALADHWQATVQELTPTSLAEAHASAGSRRAEPGAHASPPSTVGSLQAPAGAKWQVASQACVAVPQLPHATSG
jgi:hypothetical protein